MGYTKEKKQLTFVPVVETNGVGLELRDALAGDVMARMAAFVHLYGVKPVIYVRGYSLGDGSMVKYDIRLPDWTKATMTAGANGSSMAVVIDGEIVEITPAQYELPHYERGEAEFRWPFVRLLVPLPAKEGGK